ncbi:hypothetical protein LZ198_03980 [Myxococcus sp. K15C18031901]|uniref:hypothetical protein n=1 Tax=Myxococcus dinghuensis TaxID=2906761 RepID=UPI0020A7302F|nr:hypothetical protein [Myxococcus dinghuensis]MCP3098033.1 hypothetical protein [Myxococcus dinghuensis]
MGDTISSRLGPGAPSLHLGNGALSVFFDVLAVAVMPRARTDWELRLARWIVESDQLLLGLGTVGFDVSELGWTAPDFEAQQRFLVALLDAALDREGWEHLPPALRQGSPRLTELLWQVRDMVARFPREVVPLPEGDDFRWPCGPPEDGRCELHQVYLHATGCILCNDSSLDEHVPHRSPTL